MQEVSRLSRRSLMKTGLVGSLLVGLGSIGLALQKPKPAAHTPELHALDESEYAVLAAVAARLCPAFGPGAPGAAALDTATHADAMIANADPEVQKGVKIALRVFDNALTGVLSGERFKPFTELDAEAQDRVLERWRDSDVGFRRTVYKALASMISALYWGDSQTWQRMGYSGPPDMAKLRDVYSDQLVDYDALRAAPIAKGT